MTLTEFKLRLRCAAAQYQKGLRVFLEVIQNIPGYEVNFGQFVTRNQSLFF